MTDLLLVALTLVVFALLTLLVGRLDRDRPGTAARDAGADR
ncbi:MULTISPECIES: hypothetical protein [unclassified Nocardioides]|nr:MULTISPECIES: hypothetical protein [unclassified Nocardioides]